MNQAGWGAYLSKLMRARKIGSDAELARRSGINQSLISRWKKDDVAPGVDNLRRLSRALDVPLLELMVAAGVVEPKEARMADRPEPPEPPVGAGVDPALLADVEQLDPAEVQRVRDFIKGIKST